MASGLQCPFNFFHTEPPVAPQPEMKAPAVNPFQRPSQPIMVNHVVKAFLCLFCDLVPLRLPLKFQKVVPRGV